MSEDSFEIQELNDFITARESGRAKSTIQNYRSALRKFEDFCLKRDIEVTEIKNREMDTFKGLLRGDVSDITAAQYLGNISEFYKWLLLDSDKPNPVLELPQDIDTTDTQHEKPTLDEDQVRDLVDSASDMRGKTLLSLMSTTGLRLQEACNAKLSKLDLENRSLEVMTVKTGFGPRTVYFDRKTRRLLDTYINQGYRLKYNSPDSDYIFIGSNTNQYKVQEQEEAEEIGEEIDNANISTDVGRRIFMDALENSSIEVEYERYSDGRKRSKHTSHILRRSFCQNWIDSNGDIMSLRNTVGWESVETAKNYIDDKTDLGKRDRYGITL
jgi:site-specific recombinase XerD